LTVRVSPGPELGLSFTDILGSGQAVGRADGSVVLLGEPEDNGGLGAALVFTRPGGGNY